MSFVKEIALEFNESTGRHGSRGQGLSHMITCTVTLEELESIDISKMFNDFQRSGHLGFFL